jgi:hypothetical protein
MDDSYHIAYVEEPGRAEWGAVGQAIRSYNTQAAGEDNYRHVCFILYGPDEEIVGGVIGSTLLPYETALESVSR